MGHAWALGVTAACTAIGLAITPQFGLVNMAMLYLLAVVLVAWKLTRSAAILTAVAGVACFDYFFVPPVGTFSIDDRQYLLTFFIMLAVALVIGNLAESVRREAEARARLAIEAETERVRSALLASISHDLRTPLAVMTGASSSLAERGEMLDAKERQALAQSVFQQAREISEHVAKVLQMTRLESGRIELRRDWTSLAEIAGSTLRRLQDRLGNHRLLVEVPGDLPLVRVDAALIEQALGNLLENAARHTPPGTVVRLRIETRGRELLVCVEDFGPGIADDELEQVFAKFQRGRMEGGGGMGLGLAICRAIITLHHGRAWAERVVAGGTAFKFTLPLEEAPAMPIETVNA